MFIFLLASVLITASGVTSDPTQTVKAIVESANIFFRDHNVTQLQLLDLGVLPTNPIKMRKGTLDRLDTMNVQGEPIINKKKNRDNSTTYIFYVNIGLKQLSIHYDFYISHPVVANGKLSLVPDENSLEVTGIVVLGDGVSCAARLYSVTVEKLDNFQFDLNPKNIPGLTNISEAIFNYTIPRITGVTEAAFEAQTLVPAFQAWFSDFVCLYLKPKKLLDFLQNY